MKLKVTTAFNDMTIVDPNERRREIGDEFEADDVRGVALIALKLVEADGPTDPALPLPAATLQVGAAAQQPDAAAPAQTEPLPRTAETAVPEQPSPLPPA